MEPRIICYVHHPRRPDPLTVQDLNAINEALGQIDVVGERYPEQMAKLVGR